MYILKGYIYKTDLNGNTSSEKTWEIIGTASSLSDIQFLHEKHLTIISSQDLLLQFVDNFGNVINI